MKILLLVVVLLGLGGGSYYQYQRGQKALLAAEQRISLLQARLNKLQVENLALHQAKEELTQNLRQAEASLAHQAAGPAAPRTGDMTPVESPPASTTPPNPSPDVPSNELGTIVTLDGHAFQNCHLLRVQVDAISIRHASGQARILFPFLPPDLQKRFGYDAHQAGQLSLTQVKYQEDLRKAAEQVNAD